MTPWNGRGSRRSGQRLGGVRKTSRSSGNQPGRGASSTISSTVRRADAGHPGLMVRERLTGEPPPLRRAPGHRYVSGRDQAKAGEDLDKLTGAIDQKLFQRIARTVVRDCADGR